MKTTSFGRRPHGSWPQNIESGISQHPLIGSYYYFETYFVNPLNEDDFQWKATQNIKSGISQQPLIGSYSNFNLLLLWPNHVL